ncbi:MAG: YdcF family protein, partial [Chromatiaceae bacterium]
VVLGGAVGLVGDPPTENLSGGSDRILRAARLYRAGKVGRVLAVGGNQSWLGNPVPEAEAMRDLLVEWGVPAAQVLTETASGNTRENALYAAAIIREHGWTRVLLVTSARHMHRAVAAFRAAGIAVIPSATDYAVVGPQPLDVLDFLPNADALGGVSFALREWLGRAYYWLRGWGDG